MEKSLVQIAMDCCNDGHWQMRDQEPYVCFPCIDEIQKRARNAALEEVAEMLLKTPIVFDSSTATRDEIHRAILALRKS